MIQDMFYSSGAGRVRTERGLVSAFGLGAFSSGSSGGTLDFLDTLDEGDFKTIRDSVGAVLDGFSESSAAGMLARDDVGLAAGMFERDGAGLATG